MNIKNGFMRSSCLGHVLFPFSLLLAQAIASSAQAAWSPPRAAAISPQPLWTMHGNPFQPKLESALPFRFVHAILVRSQPEKESSVSEVPEEILLTFDAGVGEDMLALAVIDETGKRVDKHDAHLDFTDHSHLRASVAKLSPGRYTVRYRVLSADGHVVSGKYFFHVKAK